MAIDADLKRVWVYHPEGIPGVDRQGGGIDVYRYHDDLGPPPWRFRPIRQNGSRLHLRMLADDGTDARYPDSEPFVAGEFVERRAYTSDVRRGIYWTAED